MHDVRSLFSHACLNLLRPLKNAWSKGDDFLLLTTMSEEGTHFVRFFAI